MVVFQQSFPNLFDYFIFDNSFNSNDINLIQNLSLSLPSQDGSAGFTNTIEARKSLIKWIPYLPQFYGLYENLKEYISAANLQLWNFDIIFSEDQIQYTEYYSNIKGRYDWHTDSGNNNRKLSLVIQLSDPNEYEGGDLEIYSPHPEKPQIIKIPKEKGKIIVFPSYLWHRVTPVTKGTRKSLVWWVGGTPFR